MSIAQRIAALQKQGEAPPPQQLSKPPSQVSDRIANLQKTAEPAFLSSREKASAAAAMEGEVDEDETPKTEGENKVKKGFKPPPGAVQVLLPFAAGPPSLSRKQKVEKGESGEKQST